MAAGTSRKSNGPRSRNGCITCKIRHVKCDEEKPACRQCERSGRKCDGYDKASQAQLRQRIADRHRSLVRESSSISADHHQLVRHESGSQRRFVDFFYSTTSHAFSGFFDSKLWSYLIPQLGEREPSIRHALTAIGAIHSHFQRRRRRRSLPLASADDASSSSSSATDRFVLEEYNKSIQHLMQSLSGTRHNNTELTLTICCLFVCLEMLRGNKVQALDHIEAGVRIVHKHEQARRQRGRPNELYRELRGLFTRMNLQASFFGRAMFPLNVPTPNPPTSSLSSSSSEPVFADIPQARTRLDQLLTTGLLFIRSVGFTREERDPALQRRLEAEQEDIRRLYEGWDASFNKLLLHLHHLGAQIHPLQRRAALLLRIYHRTALFWLLSVLARAEDVFDLFIADFELIVSSAEEIVRITSVLEEPQTQTRTPESIFSSSESESSSESFSLEGEIIGPLYYLACKCRHPSIRRRAIDILTHYSKTEGLWNARRHAAVARLVMEVEESLCDGPVCSEADIGVLARVYEEVQPEEELGLNPCRVLLFLKPHGVDGPWTMRGVMVEW